LEDNNLQLVLTYSVHIVYNVYTVMRYIIMEVFYVNTDGYPA